MTAVAEISAEDWNVWRTFFLMRRQLDRVLEHQLQRDAGISAPDYEILLTLFQATQRQLRAREIGALLGWEKSRLSHQVTRMTSRGLVERRDCDTDGRGTWIVLTADGSRAVLSAMRDHAATVRRLFFDVLTEQEKQALLSASHRILGAVTAEECAGSSPSTL